MRGPIPAPLQLRLHARPESGRLLRERVRTWLDEAGANNREIFEVLLATSEAFANAVEHPRQPRFHLVDIEASISDHTVTVSIHDYGQWDGNQKREQTGGFGLSLMEHLMDVVRLERSPEGTTLTVCRNLAMH